MESDRHAGQRRRSCPPAQAAQSKPGLQSSAEHGIREVVALRALSPERILSGCVAQEESLPLSCLCPKKDNSAHLKEDWPVNSLISYVNPRGGESSVSAHSSLRHDNVVDQDFDRCAGWNPIPLSGMGSPGGKSFSPPPDPSRT